MYNNESELKRRELDLKVKGIEESWNGDDNILKNEEAREIFKTHKVKKEYNYGKDWYGAATLELLDNGWTVTTNHVTGVRYLHKNGEGFAFAKACVQRYYQLTRMMGF